MSLAPLRWLGLGGEVRRLHVPLFRGYREKREVPFMAATVSIKVGWAGAQGWCLRLCSFIVV